MVAGVGRCVCIVGEWSILLQQVERGKRVGDSCKTVNGLIEPDKHSVLYSLLICLFSGLFLFLPFFRTIDSVKGTRGNNNF